MALQRCRNVITNISRKSIESVNEVVSCVIPVGPQADGTEHIHRFSIYYTIHNMPVISSVMEKFKKIKNSVFLNFLIFKLSPNTIVQFTTKQYPEITI